MFRFVLFILSALLISFKAQAWLPTYDDDAEFGRCTKSTNDWNFCAQEESFRALNNVKKQYKAILTSPEIVSWHNRLDENTATMRDMYEGLTAFRNRICSLSFKAAENIEPLVDARASCDLFHTLHHQDHLDKVLLLLKGEVPENYNDFEFLQILEHDKEYQPCMEAEEKKQDENKIKSKEEVLNSESESETESETASETTSQSRKEKCVAEELKRSTRDIKNYYKTFVNDEFVGKWNNGDGLKQGNYRDMYDSWIAYRNRMCALAVWAYQRAYGKDSITSDDCILYYNREKFEIMQNTLIAAHSFLDDEALPEANDGGEAEGKTITPLQKRIAVEEQTEDEILSQDDKDSTEEAESEDNSAAEAETEKTTETQPQKSVPSWANPADSRSQKQNTAPQNAGGNKQIPSWASKN